MRKICLLTVFAALSIIGGQAQTGVQFDRYHQPEEISRMMIEMADQNKSMTTLHEIGKSWSGMPVYLLEISGETSKKKPAVFVAANFEGSHPLASEGALWLMQDLIENPDHCSDLTWYILPTGNPEAALSFFQSPKLQNERNLRPYNDDMDDQVDEDPAEDLNGDGYITQMRVRVPDGTMIQDTTDARMMKRADASKGEVGIYKVYTEGIDNDGDGRYNEDGIGGTNNGIAFPHLFRYHHPGSGEWPGQEEEVFGVMKFFTDHPEIALVMYYGPSNFCLQPPKSGRKGETNMSSLKIPRRFASMLNADPEKTYSMSEVKEMVKAIVPPGTPVDDSMIAGMLNLGPAVNPLAKDLKIYTELTKKYEEYLKENNGDQKRLPPSPASDGSFELWVYYHQGLPVFTQDFWGVPVFEKAQKDSAQEKKPGSQMAARGKKPPKPNPEKTFLAYNDSLLDGKGFVNWEVFDHPDFGEIEIGGRVPYADQVPPADSIKSLLSKQIPWIYVLSEKIPKLQIEAEKLTDLGGDIYRLEIWIRNKGEFHFPTAMGSRNGTPPPAIVLLEGKKLEVLQGLQRTPLKGLDAGGLKKLTWLIRIPGSQPVNVRVQAVNAYGSEKTIQTGGN